MKSDLNQIEKKLKGKIKRREKKKGSKMQVSGKTVFKLGEIMRRTKKLE